MQGCTIITTTILLGTPQVPVLQRGMKGERTADVKRKAALIAGNMCSMISDPKDMVPYLPSLLPGLQQVKSKPCTHPQL